MRGWSVLGAVLTLSLSILAIFATDFVLAKNNALVFGRMIYDQIGEYGILIAVLIIPFLTLILVRLFPPSVREFLLNAKVGNIIGVLNRDDARYRKLIYDHLRNASHIDVIGIGNSQFSEQNFLRDFEDDISRNRARIRVLFLNPDGKRVAERELDEGFDVGWLSNQIRAHVRFFDGAIKSIWENHPPMKGLIERRFYDLYPSANMILLDRKVCFLQPYLYRLRGRATPTLLFLESNVELVKTFQDEFDRIWTSGSEGEVKSLT